MPTWTDVVGTQLGNVVKGHEVLRLDFESVLSTYINPITTAMDLDGQAAPAATAMGAGFRAALSSALNPGGMIRSLMDPYVLQIGTLIKSPNRSTGNTSLMVAPDMVRYMIDNPDALVPAPRFLSRQFTNGATVAGGGNVGGGTVVRCLVTADGQPIENRFADTISFLCEQDISNGALKQREGFSVHGQNLVDPLDYYQAGKGTGLAYLYLNGTGTAITAINSDTAATAGVQNTSFAAGGAGANRVPTGWVATTAATNFDVVADNLNAAAASRTIYRIADSETGGACSVKLKAADTLTQSLAAIQLNNNAPYYLEVAYNAGIGAGNATLQIGLGSYTTTVVLTGGAGWHTLKLPISKNLWLKNFNNGNVAITIGLSAYTSGYVLVDDVRFASFQNAQWNTGTVTNGAYDNQWILIVSEASGSTGQLNFEIGDTFTITDSEIGAEYQRKFHLAYGATMPVSPPGPGAGLAAALAGAGAGNLSNGVYKYVITKVRKISDSDFSESGISAFATVTVADHTTNGKTSESGFPVDTDPGIYGYNLYRTQAGGSTYTYVTQILYANIGTPYVDNASDASIVGNAAPPGGVTIADP
jgi:hypothetical protein